MSSSDGNRLENEVRKVIEDIIAEKYKFFAPRVLRKPKVPGLSSIWEPDIVVVAESIISGEYSIYVAIIECKYIGEKSSPGIYWDAMSRSYMELNDLRMNPELRGPKFYLVVNYLFPFLCSLARSRLFFCFLFIFLALFNCLCFSRPAAFSFLLLLAIF